MTSLSGGGSSHSNLLYLQVELGLYDRFATVQQTTALCQLNVVQLSHFKDESEDGDDPTECPHPGLYQWTAYYTVPSSIIADSNLHYTPDVRLTFSNDQGQRVGCVVTGPIALRGQADAKAVAGLVALGVSLAVFIGIFAVLLYLSHHRKILLERTRTSNNVQQQVPAAAMQYRYFRTLPNGRVEPVAGHPPKRQQQQLQRPEAPQLQHQRQQLDSDSHDDDSDSEDALHISNPAYNETHLPSRPII